MKHKSTKQIDGDESGMEGYEAIHTGLDRREHHLRTLHDVSKELFAIVDIKQILRNFLMMAAGNFGVIEAFIMTMDIPSYVIIQFECIGFGEKDRKPLVEGGRKLLMDWDKVEVVLENCDFKNLIVFPQSVSCVLPFMVDERCSGLLGLGPKLVGEPYTDQDKELLVTLVNNFIIAVRNAIAFEDIKRLNLDMQAKHKQLKKAFDDLDRRVYHLKTLNDVSKDIFGSVDFESILKNFLLISMGNFGVIEGLILTLEMSSREMTHFVSNGYDERGLPALKKEVSRFLLDSLKEGLPENLEVIKECQYLKPNVACGVCFKIEGNCSAFLGLGPKLIGEPYSEEDKELLVTLINNLVVALKNAISFENIKRLNMDLQEKNVQLENALKKVELLENIKANLSKFVPNTVTKMIEKSPTGEIQDSKERDVSVLFLDIEGYTKITERIGGIKVNRLIEKYFSVFMDAIYANNGDVNETAGDGLMVIYLSEDEKTNALEAVRTAITVREKTALINQEEKSIDEPLLINIGICSGPAFVGAAKFDSYTGSRWTYTSHGTTTNLAARICSQATGGSIMISKSTAERVKDHFTIQSLGKFRLKNVSEEVEILSL